MCEFETSPTGQRCVRAMSLRVWIMQHIWRDRWTHVRMKRRRSEGGSQNMLVDHLFQHKISTWPGHKQPRNADFAQSLRTDGRTDPLTEMRSRRTHLKITYKSSIGRFLFFPHSQNAIRFPPPKFPRFPGAAPSVAFLAFHQSCINSS